MEHAGAQTFNNLDTHLAPFIKKDNLSFEQVKQYTQQLIFNLNIPSRWGAQAVFSNFTFDITCPKDMANEKAIVGGKECDFTYGDCQNEMDLFNLAFIEVMQEGDSDGQVHTFPIPTYNIDENFDWNSPIANKLFEMTAKYGTPYFSNYINSGMDAQSVRSMCPMTPDTMLLIKSNQNGISIKPIGDIYSNNNRMDTEYEVWTKQGWSKCKPIQLPKTKVYKITLSNGIEIKFGENHMQPIMGGQVLKTSELEENMWLPFNKNEIGTTLGDFELGFAIGSYTGDGSKSDRGIIYSLCDNERDKPTAKRLIKFWENLGFNTSQSISNKNVHFVRINGNPIDIIERYVKGDNALEKSLTRHVFNSSIEFKKGFIEGFHATDGSEACKRLYTSSLQLRYDITYLLASLGQKYSITYTDTRENRLGNNPNYRIDFPKIKNYGDKYKEDDDYQYYRIEKIEEYNYRGQYLYCLEVYNDNMQFMLANGLITRNCRLRLDLSELRKKSGGFFGAGDLTGSIGVVTLNLPRLGFICKTKEEFFNKLNNLMDIAKESLDIKRIKIKETLDSGLLPYTFRYLEQGLINHFSTIGIIGMNECLENFMNKNITTKEGNEFANEILDHINARLSKYQEESPDQILYNLEATPAEGTSYRLAKIDKEKYPNIKTANDSETPYYTNSVHLPVGYTDDIFKMLELEDDMQSKFTSGTVIHLFLGEQVDSGEKVKNLIRRIFTNYKLPYISLTPTFSTCIDHGYIKGEVYECPTCGKNTEVWSRVTGYWRPISSYNKGKKQEFKDRKYYSLRGEQNA